MFLQSTSTTPYDQLFHFYMQVKISSLIPTQKHRCIGLEIHHAHKSKLPLGQTGRLVLFLLSLIFSACLTLDFYWPITESIQKLKDSQGWSALFQSMSNEVWPWRPSRCTGAPAIHDFSITLTVTEKCQQLHKKCSHLQKTPWFLHQICGSRTSSTSLWTIPSNAVACCPKDSQ